MMNGTSRLLAQIWSPPTTIQFFQGNITSVISTTPAATPETRVTPLLELVIRTIIMALICLGSIVGNSLVFIVFYKKQHWLFTISNRFILNLALTNFLMGVFIMPFTLISTVVESWVFGQAWCQITALMSTVLLAACILTLLLISLDRYCAVVTPLHYTRRVTPSSSNYALAAVWVTSVVLSIPPIFGWSMFAYQNEKHSCTVNWKSITVKDRSYGFFYSITCFYLPFSIMIWIYCSILRVSQVTSARARRNSVLPDANLMTSSSEPGLVNGSRRRGSLMSRRGSALSFGRVGLIFRKDEWKTAKTSLLVMSAITFCWLPYFLLITLESALSDPRNIPPSVETLAVWMACAGCAINPLVYFFRNSSIRGEIPKLLRRFYSESRRHSCDSEMETQGRPRSRQAWRRASESVLSNYLNRRRSSTSVHGTVVTQLSTTSLQSDDCVAVRRDANTGWFPEGYFSRQRRSLDSILANSCNGRLLVNQSQIRQAHSAKLGEGQLVSNTPVLPLVGQNNHVEVPDIVLPGEMPR